jgi:hypothetical protein
MTAFCGAMARAVSEKRVVRREKKWRSFMVWDGVDGREIGSIECFCENEWLLSGNVVNTEDDQD